MDMLSRIRNLENLCVAVWGFKSQPPHAENIIINYESTGPQSLIGVWNFGIPVSTCARGRYGDFLMEQWGWMAWKFRSTRPAQTDWLQYYERFVLLACFYHFMLVRAPLDFGVSLAGAAPSLQNYCIFVWRITSNRLSQSYSLVLLLLEVELFHPYSEHLKPLFIEGVHKFGQWNRHLCRWDLT